MKHAVIYVPGLNQHQVSQSAQVVVERIAASLKASRADLDDVRVNLSKSALKLGETSADRATLEGLADGAWTDLVDVYEVNYLEGFVARFIARSSIERALSAIRVFLANARRIPAIFTGRSKGLLDRLQGGFLSVLIAFLGFYLVYWVFVAAAAVFGIGTLLDFKYPDTKAVTLAGLTATALAAAGTAANFAFKTSVAKLERSAIEFYALCEYLKDDTAFAASQAMVRDCVVALRRAGYDRVDLLCFSTGCLIAGDALYPRRAGLRATSDQIDDWVTIGYPYDLVKIADPAYFKGRQAPAITRSAWLNMTEIEDFLGSNFRDDDDADETPSPTSGIFFAGGDARPDRNLFFAPESILKRSWLDAIYPGRRAVNHGLYWDPDDANAPSCFTALVQAGFCNPAPAHASAAPEREKEPVLG